MPMSFPGPPAFPSLEEQWRRGRPAPTYRCGGSAGLAAALEFRSRTGFPFHPPRIDRARQTPAAKHYSGA